MVLKVRSGDPQRDTGLIKWEHKVGEGGTSYSRMIRLVEAKGCTRVLIGTIRLF